MSTAQLRREITHLRERRSSRHAAVPEDRLQFTRALGIVPDPWQERLLCSEAARVLLNCPARAVNQRWLASWGYTRPSLLPAR